jgi:hypothetical protein
VRWNIPGNRLAADVIRARIESFLPIGSDPQRPHE